MRKRKTNLPIRLIIVILVISVFIFVGISYSYKIIKNLELFNVIDVVVRPESPIDFSYLKGRNIFGIDLEKESKYLLRLHPECSRIRMVRVFPNRIFIDFIERRPIAVVKLYRYFVLDREGALFNAVDLKADADLPLILGLETKIFKPRSGERYNIKEINFILSFLKAVEGNNTLNKYKIKTIDVGNLDNISLFINNKQKNNSGYDVQVKLSKEKISDKLDILASIFAKSQGGSLEKLKYIDLRFKEPVIKYAK